MGLFTSSTKTTKSPFETNPWKPQQGYLTTGFNQGQKALNSGLKTMGQIDDNVADMTGGQHGVLSRISQNGQGYGQVNNMSTQAAVDNLGNIGAYGTNANDIYNKTGVDPTQTIINNASQYADNPHLQGQIDSALGDVRKAFDRDVAGINAAAVGSGNINSTRAGVMESRALDDAMDRGAAISSGMRSNAYNTGLGMAQGQYNTGIAQQLQANSAIGQSGLTGLNAATMGAGLNSQGLQEALAAETAYQQQAQNEIEGQYRQAGQNLGLVGQYMGIVGGNHGQSGFTTHVTESPSIFQQIAGAAATVAGAL